MGFTNYYIQFISLQNNGWVVSYSYITISIITLCTIKNILTFLYLFY